MSSLKSNLVKRIDCLPKPGNAADAMQPLFEAVSLRLTKRDRRVELTSALGEYDLTAIEASAMDDGLDHLNAELPTDKHAAD